MDPWLFTLPVIALTSSSPATEDVLWSHGGKSDSSDAIIQRINGSNLFASTANVDLTKASQMCQKRKMGFMLIPLTAAKQRIIYKRTYILYIRRIWKCARLSRSGYFLICMCQHDHLRPAISCPLINTQTWQSDTRPGIWFPGWGLADARSWIETSQPTLSSATARAAQLFPFQPCRETGMRSGTAGNKMQHSRFVVWTEGWWTIAAFFVFL